MWWPPEAEGVAGPQRFGDGPADGEATRPDGEWTTGDEPMTDPQASYLDTLADDLGVDVPRALNKAEASDLIDELQRRADDDQGETDR
jgi:hypothetical protein